MVNVQRRKKSRTASFRCACAGKKKSFWILPSATQNDHFTFLYIGILLLILHISKVNNFAWYCPSGILLPSASSFVLQPKRTYSSSRDSNIKSGNAGTSTALHGIRGFRAWFESEFPNAMTAIDHPSIMSRMPPSKKQESKNKSSTTSPNKESFHHVLIDVNQLLHITLRRSVSNEHALVLLLKELDKCLTIALPSKSIVLAFDGPPAAAKLATQRRRRYGVITRGTRRKERIKLLAERGLVDFRKSKEKKSRKIGKKMSREEREELTLSITPGTQFMKSAEQAVLYWAWQRLSNLRGKLQIQNCRIYISPSSVPGEGEVKLLDWLYQGGGGRGGDIGKVIKQGDSVAIMGGDSDLVLEGLLIPPSITHNVFVILPSGSSKSYSVSLWETTLTLARFLGPQFDPNNSMRVRTDLVLLLIMNGNDYLPKLRGIKFNKLFHTYLYVLKKWLKESEIGTQVSTPYLIDPDTLEFNLDFCIRIFEHLASIAPRCILEPSELIPCRKSITPLSHLNTMVDSGLLPGPAKFERLEFLNENNEVDNEKEVLRLTLGDETINDMKANKNNKKNADSVQSFFEFDAFHRVGRPLKKSKQLLANIALEDILGKDYMEFSDDFVGNDTNESDDEDSGSIDNDDENELGLNSLFNSIGYSWEMETAAASSVEEYLKGLIWNLATYQDGVCADYAYNYGRRMSPTAEELVSFFRDAKEKNKHVGREGLLSNNFTEPLSDHLSCLAALPTEVRYLLPDNYRHLAESGIVEKIYASCMNNETNVFDLELFRRSCMERVEDNHNHNKAQTYNNNKKGREVRTGNSFWTVLRRTNQPLTHPFDPPEGFCDRLASLRKDNKIKVFHFHATDRPRWLSSETKHRKTVINTKNPIDLSKFSDMGGLISHAGNLENVKYISAYKSKSQSVKEVFVENVIEPTSDHEYTAQENVENRNGLQCLHELKDSGFFDVSWMFFPDGVSETVKLNIKSESKRVNFNVEEVRNVYKTSKSRTKQVLAAVALSQLISNSRDWRTMTLTEMKSHMDDCVSHD
mmetsp:Transcript_9399/g.11882  ORF Transcript_9399/g.11882 Transcript_9399/m.11882 type:complete len:1032 (-) Transcript_9399:343-3438(-)